MVSAGQFHTVLLQCNGRAVACGRNDFGQCDLPPLDEGMSYTQVSAGRAHSVLLRSDGCAVACGRNDDEQCSLPPLPPFEGMRYIQVSAGERHTVLLRSDGKAFLCGFGFAPKDVQPLDMGQTFIQVSAGRSHIVLLRSDGNVVAFAGNDCGQRNIPSLDEGMSYTQVSAGGYHTVLLRSDGHASACGLNNDGQCTIPPLVEAMSYTQVTAGRNHTVLLRSDGCAVACGDNEHGQCDIPSLHEGLSYIQVSAGWFHTVLLRSDGSAVACGRNFSDPAGRNFSDETNIPLPEPGTRYICDRKPLGRDVVLQLDLSSMGAADAVDVLELTCSSLAGQEVSRLKVSGSDSLLKIHERIACELKTDLLCLRAVLRSGQLLASLYRANPETTVADLWHCQSSSANQDRDLEWHPVICDRGWELGYIPATSFLPAKCVGQAQNVRVSVCVCACPSRWIRSNSHDMVESLRLVSCLAIHLQPWCLNNVECVLFVCVCYHTI